MPKLFQIVVEGNRGSTGTIAESIGNYVIQNGWDSYIAHGRFPRPSASHLLRIGSDYDVFIHGIKTRLCDKHGFGSKHATQVLIEKIKCIKPDLIHLHHLHGYYINIDVLFKYLSRASIPVVWTFHDCWAMTGHCTHFDFVGCQKWKTECQQCPQTHEYPKSFFIDRSRKNFKSKRSLFTSIEKMVIVNVSNWLNNIVASSFLAGIPRNVIYNGIDVFRFKPTPDSLSVKARFNITGRFLILGVAGVWNERKGLGDFIKLSRLIGDEAVVVLIGVTKRQKRELPCWIIALEKTENVDELAEFYSAADVFLNLSVEETFGLTTAEALACGTPAIVYNSTACPELIDNDTGIVVEKNNEIALMDAIGKIKKNGKTFYTHACRTRAIQLFNREDRLKDYMDLYRSMISAE